MQPSPFNCKPPAPQPLADHKNRNRLHRILNGSPSGPRIMANSSRPYQSTGTANTASKRAGRHRRNKSSLASAAAPAATDAHEKAADEKIIDGKIEHDDDDDDMPRTKLQHTVSSDTTLSSGVDDSPEASTENLKPQSQPPQTNGDDIKKPAINGFHDAVSDEPYPELAASKSGDRHENGAWRAGGVRFAPLRIPLRRRLQTAAVLWHCMGIATFLAIFWFTCANPLMWPLLVPYLIYMSFSSAPVDGKLARRSERLRSLKLWRWFADYFPMRLHKTQDLDPNRRYIMGYHPHGIISHGAWSAFATNALGFREKFPGITNSLLTLDSNFRIPFHRDWILAMGISSVSKESIRNLLSRGGKNNDGKGRAVTIVIGGARESLEAEPGHMRLVLKNRKGFVKMALRAGADLVPVMGFGENDIYDQLNAKTHPGVHRFQMFCLKVFKFTLPAMHGRGLLNYDVGLMPYRRPVNIVVGRPIRIDTEPGHQPTAEEVDRYHEIYVCELEKLWESYKDQFCPGRISELEFKD